MKHSCKVSFAERYFITSFEPCSFLLLIFFYRKYRYLSTLFVTVGFLNHIYDSESSLAFLYISYSKKEPNVVSISIYVVLYHEKILTCLRCWYECFTNIATLKICINTVLNDRFWLFLLLLQLFEHLVIIVSHWIYRQKLSFFISIRYLKNS